MAKWNLDTIEADMAEIRESVDKLEEINRLQAQTIERQAEQLRQAQQSLRNARDSALEDAINEVEAVEGDAWLKGDQFRLYDAVERIRSLKSTTQGSRE